MSTTSNVRNELERIHIDIHRITRPQVRRETLEQMWERVSALWLDGCEYEAVFVAEQARYEEDNKE